MIEASFCWQSLSIILTDLLMLRHAMLQDSCCKAGQQSPLPAFATQFFALSSPLGAPALFYEDYEGQGMAAVQVLPDDVEAELPRYHDLHRAAEQLHAVLHLPNAHPVHHHGVCHPWVGLALQRYAHRHAVQVSYHSLNALCIWQLLLFACLPQLPQDREFRMQLFTQSP